MTGIVVPLAERKSNAVDDLFAQARKLQSECQHDFKLTVAVELENSRVPDVFIGESIDGQPAKLSMRCLGCSLEKTASVDQKCPRCLSAMEKGTLEDPNKYHGERPHMVYYSSRPYKCTACGCKLVLDEWDL